MSGVKFVEASSEDAGQRLDNFLLRVLKGVPKTLIYRIIRKGEVRVNKGRAQASQRLEAGDLIRIPPVKVASKGEEIIPPEQQISKIEKLILFEDKDLLVVNKPAGMAVHGGSGVDWGLVELVRQARPLARRIELAHRLDRDTSGVIILAKKVSVLRSLHDQFRANQVLRKYKALLVGAWPENLYKVDLPLRRFNLESGERRVEVHSSGKPSESRFKLLEKFTQASLVEVQLITGRTHQIRVHSQANSHPIVGDDKYGKPKDNQVFKELGIDFLALHSYQVGFKHPVSDEWIEIEAPFFTGFEQAINKLRGGK